MSPDEDLLEACQEGQPARALLALENGAHPNTARDVFGFTPLMSAARLGNVELVQVLLAAGAVVKARHDMGLTALAFVDGGNTELFDVLVDAGADIRQASLTNIARAGNIDLMNQVISAGVPVDPAGANKTSALMSAVTYGQLEMAKRLVNDHGADVNFHNEFQTALTSAAHTGNVEAVRFLLSAGAKTTVGKAMALHHGASSGEPEIVELLLKAGAEVDEVNSSGVTALCEAQLLRDKPQSLDVASMLIAAGADVNFVAADGMSPLHVAADQARLDVAQILVAAGADLSCRTDEGLTPLEIALAAEIIDTSQREHVRKPTKPKNDDYYEICGFLLGQERNAGLLTPERATALAALAEAHRCPALHEQIADS